MAKFFGGWEPDKGWARQVGSKNLQYVNPKSLQMVTAAMKLKDTYFLEEKL